MIVSCRLFKLEEFIALKQLHKKLKEKRKIESQKIKMNEEDLELLTFIDDVTMEENNVHGSIVYEYPLPISQVDDTVKWVKEAIRVKFVFTQFQDSIFFIPSASSARAEDVATKMNNAINMGDVILKQTFSPNMIESFLRRNPHRRRSGRWAGLDIPGVSKAALAGTDLLQSPDSSRYDQHGHKSFVIVTLNENGWTIGLSHIGGIVFYSAVNEENRLQFVKSKIIPLL